MNQPTETWVCRVNNTHEKLPGTDPRVRRTRQLLQNALVELMGEMRFNQISVQDIAARAGVNRATFYAHFEDKYALVNYYVHESFITYLRERLPANREFSEATTRIFIKATAEFLKSFFGHCTPIDHAHYPQITSQVQIILYDLFMEWQDWEEFGSAPTQSPETTATALSWLIFGSTFRWAQGGLKISVDELADSLVPYIKVGLQGAGV